MGAMKEPAATLYEADYHAWTQEQAARLRQGDFAHLAVVNLVEEIESLGRSEKRELQSRMSQLPMHLLKRQHQPSRRPGSWTRSFQEQRRSIAALLDDMPSPRSHVEALMASAYGDALVMLERETGLGIEDMPQACPYAFEQVMASGWPPADRRRRRHPAFADVADRHSRLGATMHNPRDPCGGAAGRAKAAGPACGMERPPYLRLDLMQINCASPDRRHSPADGTTHPASACPRAKKTGLGAGPCLRPLRAARSP